MASVLYHIAYKTFSKEFDKCQDPLPPSLREDGTVWLFRSAVVFFWAEEACLTNDK